MTPTEFKAWFEGFCEAIDTAPTAEQWAKIKAKVADIRGKPAVTLRDDVLKRWSDRGQRDEPPLIARGVGENVGQVAFAAAERGFAGHNARPIAPERPFASGRIPVSHETRVHDLVTGADLGPSD